MLVEGIHTDRTGQMLVVTSNDPVSLGVPAEGRSLYNHYTTLLTYKINKKKTTGLVKRADYTSVVGNRSLDIGNGYLHFLLFEAFG